MKIIESGGGRTSFTANADALCMFCGHCIAACPTDAIAIDTLDPSQFPRLTDPPSSFTALHSLMLERRSVRVFKDTPVDQKDIDHILAAVATAPSGMGGGPAPVCIIRGRDKLDPMIPPMMEFYRKFQRGMKGAFSRVLMRFALGTYRYAAMKQFMPLIDGMIDHYDNTHEDVLTWGAPLLLVFHAPRTGVSGEADCVIACTYAMLAAQSLKLATTMIGMVPPYIEKTKEERRRLGIPDDHAVVLSLIIGHPTMKFTRGIQRPVTIT
jgi:nitroreductase